MADTTITETCSCGATFRANGTTYRSVSGGGTNGQHRSVEEMAERWRTEHKHIDPQPNADHTKRRFRSTGRPTDA